jgi:parvulin-like peptidyl-prolyl isomerase
MLEGPYKANGYPVYAESVIYDPAFQKAAMELEKAGDVSGPVVSSFGVHILQYLKDIPEGAIELTDAMKEEIRESLRTDTVNTVAQEWITKATDEADIVWTEAGGAWKPAEETAAEETAETAGEAATEETAPDGTIVK